MAKAIGVKTATPAGTGHGVLFAPLSVLGRLT